MAEILDDVVVRTLEAPELRSRRDELVALLADAVDGGASVGYVLPHANGEYARFWDEVTVAAATEDRVVLVCERRGRIAGAVQFAPCNKPNGRHRGEVQKLLVLRESRGEGIGARLMREVEALAVRRGFRLLLLDTRAESAAERLYRRLGWQPFGSVPTYAADPDGALADCVFFFKRCGEGSA
jgi:ribosomal protein S18 acetylase RimI-like enzyme